MDTDEGEIREALEKRLHRPASETIWRSLVEDQYVSEVVWDELSISQLAEEYRRRERRAREYHRERRGEAIERREVPPDRRTVLISKLLAREANRLPEVKQFRRKYLPERLLPRKEVELWIKGHAKAEGRATQWLVLPVPKGHEVKRHWDTIATGDLATGIPELEVSPPLTLGRLPRSVGETMQTITWADEDRRTKRAYVTDGGVVDELSRLSERLARRFHWPEAAATTFVLTGQIPLISPLTAEVNRSHFQNPSGHYYRARINMDIDPEVPPETVAKVYSKIRREVRRGSRNRPLTEKIARLVEFVVVHGEGRWREKMVLWNRRYPEDRYANEKRFARDYHRAVKKLLRPPKW